MSHTISWSDFEKIDIRIGTVIDARIFEKAQRPAYQLWIDFGPEIGILKSSAQITHHYTTETLIGRQVLAVINFPPKQIANFISECLVTGFADENGHIVLASVDSPVPNGAKLI